MQCANCGSEDEFIVDDHCHRCDINVYDQPGGNPYLEHDSATRALALEMIAEQQRASDRADHLYEYPDDDDDFYATAGTPTDWEIARNARNI